MEDTRGKITEVMTRAERRWQRGPLDRHRGGGKEKGKSVREKEEKKCERKKEIERTGQGKRNSVKL